MLDSTHNNQGLSVERDAISREIHGSNLSVGTREVVLLNLFFDEQNLFFPRKNRNSSHNSADIRPIGSRQNPFPA
jgi:hypothetical protein